MASVATLLKTYVEMRFVEAQRVGLLQKKNDVIGGIV